MSWTLLRPLWLWLLVALPLFLLGRPRESRGAERGVSFLALLLSMGAWILLTIGAAGPAIEKKLPDLAAAILLDHSASIDSERWKAALQLARPYVDAMAEEPMIVVDASTPVVVGSLREAAKVEAAPPELGSDPRTAVEQILSTLLARSERRLLWITDGAVSGPALDRAFAGAAAADLRVFPVPVDEGPSWLTIEDLQLDQDRRQGEQVRAFVSLRSGGFFNETLLIEAADYEGGWKELTRVDIETSGSPATLQQVELEFQSPAAGLHRLRVRSASNDVLAWDDEREGVLRVIESPRVHVVGAGDSLAPLLAAIRSAPQPRPSIERHAALSIGLLSSIGVDDMVLLVDPSFEDLGEPTSAALSKAVRRGLRLLVTSGPKELAVPDEGEHPAKAMLPLILPKKKKKEPAPMAVVFCIDASDSMARENKFELALAAVANTVSLLNREAEVAVITFNDNPRVEQPLGPIADTDTFARDLSRLRTSGGTSMYPALEIAQEMLAKSNARIKHLFVATDGQSVTSFSTYGSVVTSLKRNKVTVSSVGLGQDMDRDELSSVASAGGGQAYFVNDLSELPKIFLEETLEVVRKNQVERATPVVPVPGSRFLEGIDLGAVPPIYGYVRGRQKPSSELAMATDRGEPILLSWRYGRGAVTVLTTEPESDWTRDWKDWRQSKSFYRRLVEQSLRPPPPPEISLSSEPAEGGARLSFSALDTLRNPRSDLEIELNLYEPGGSTQRFVMTPWGPGRYESLVPLSGPRLASAHAIGERPDPIGASSGPVPGGEAVLSLAPRPPLESRLGTRNPAALERAAQRTGGKVGASPSEFANAKVAERTETEERSLSFLIWGFGLWGGALVVRRAATFLA